jgi:uracil-DNA glycosylase family 4
MRKISKTEPSPRSGRARSGPAAASDTSSSSAPATGALQPEHNCRLCPRLAAFRDTNRLREPSWFNAPVPPFGDRLGSLLVVGLAPGLQGANRTGRPFTGDYAGDLLYGTLIEFGFAAGHYEARPDDGLRLVDCRIGNAVHCVPPQNKPLPAEINTCRKFLAATRADMPRLRAVVMLGRIAHDSTIKVFGLRAAEAPFGHGREHQAGDVRLFDSYHCSRYNTNTGVLTADMFRAVFASVRRHLGATETARAASLG